MVMNKAEKIELRERFFSHARTMFFSRDTIDCYLDSATLGQIQATLSMFEHEVVVRESARKGRLLRKAKFPIHKSLADFDFSEIHFPDGYSKEDMLSLDFVRHAQDFVFFGKTGRGKTHLAIALGLACVEAQMAVRFFSTADLVLSLGKAKREEKLDSLLKELMRADVIILDEFGYVPLDIDGARLLYQVISSSYETRSIIFTTNIEFSRWGTVFADEKLAAATVDRVVHHGRLIEFGGSSKRMDRSLMLGKI